MRGWFAKPRELFEVSMRTSRPSTRTRAPVGPSSTRSFFQVFASFRAAISARQNSVRLVLMRQRVTRKHQRRAIGPAAPAARNRRTVPLYFFRISLATNCVAKRLPPMPDVIRNAPFTWTGVPTAMPESSFVSPFTMTSREEIFQCPSGAPPAVATGGIDSTVPSNSVAWSPGPGGTMMVVLTIESATRYEGARDPGGGSWTRARTSTVSPTFGSPTIFVSALTVTPRPSICHCMAPIDRTAPRNAMRSGGVTVPYASTLVARRPLTPPEFTTETVASMPAERSPMPLTDPFGPKPDHFVAAFVEMEWKNIVNFPPATSTPWIVETSWPSRGRKTMTLVAWKGGGGNMVGIASPTGTCATTRAPTGIPVTGRIPVAGRGPAIGPSPLVMVAFATSIRNWPPITSRMVPATAETVPSIVETRIGDGELSAMPSAEALGSMGPALKSAPKRRRATTRAEEVLRGGRERRGMRARGDRVVIVALLPTERSVRAGTHPTTTRPDPGRSIYRRAFAFFFAGFFAAGLFFTSFFFAGFFFVGFFFVGFFFVGFFFAAFFGAGFFAAFFLPVPLFGPPMRACSRFLRA